MFNFIKIQFEMGKIDAATVASFAPKFITAEDVKIITGNKQIGGKKQ